MLEAARVVAHVPSCDEPHVGGARMNEPWPEETDRPWDAPGLHPGRVRVRPVLVAAVVYVPVIACAALLDGTGTALALVALVTVAFAFFGRGHGPAPELQPRARRLKVHAPFDALQSGAAWVMVGDGHLHVQSTRAPDPAAVLIPLLLTAGVLVSCCGPCPMLSILGGGIATTTSDEHLAWQVPLGAGVCLLLTAFALHATSIPTRLVLPTSWVTNARRDGRTVFLTLDVRGGPYPLRMRGDPEVLHALLDELHAVGVQIDPGKPVEARDPLR